MDKQVDWDTRHIAKKILFQTAHTQYCSLLLDYGQISRVVVRMNGQVMLSGSTFEEVLHENGFGTFNCILVLLG